MQPRTVMREENRHEARCAQCGRKLGEGYALDFTIKCPRCGAYNRLRAMSPDRKAAEPVGRCGLCPFITMTG